MGPTGKARRLLAVAGLVLTTALGASAAAAGALTGTLTVRDGAGRPVDPSAAVVYLVGFTEPATGSVVTIEQRGRRFVPDLVAITAGDDVDFPNRDSILHNVFSTSSVRPFDLGSYKRGQSKRKGFPTAGVVDVYCNIHPEMAATILVLPNRRFTRPGRAGRFNLPGVPPGRWTVFAYVRAAVRPASAVVEVGADGSAAVTLVLTVGAEPPHVNKFGERYRDPARYR